MNSLMNKTICATLFVGLFPVSVMAEHGGVLKTDINLNPKACRGFGPQAPRDIDNLKGENPRIFSLAPDYQQMNLCNIHFHANAEHKALDFSIYAGTGDGHGIGGGYQCNISQSLSAVETKPFKDNACSGVNPGDTIEVHWVHSSCQTRPGYSLGACTSPDDCINPQLRVETQVFTVVNDANALNFTDFSYGGNVVNGYHQAKTLPENTGKPVEFTGSTTGPNYNNQCSAYQASWSVRPHCAKVDIASLSRWCKHNVFDEKGAHGVRVLITNPKLLSPIK
ncbi:MAG: hypothetical protein ACI9FJ_002043 [Alteromonadaceae bacterium]|jgi:hypothetical protein